MGIARFPFLCGRLIKSAFILCFVCVNLERSPVNCFYFCGTLDGKKDTTAGIRFCNEIDTQQWRPSENIADWWKQQKKPNKWRGERKRKEVS